MVSFQKVSVPVLWLNVPANNPNFDSNILSVTLVGLCISSQQQGSVLIATWLPGTSVQCCFGRMKVMRTFCRFHTWNILNIWYSYARIASYLFVNLFFLPGGKVEINNRHYKINMSKQKLHLENDKLSFLKSIKKMKFYVCSLI